MWEAHTHTIQCLWSIPGSTVWVDRVVKWVYDNVVYSHNSIGTATVLTDITRFLFEEKLIVAGHIRFAHVLWKYNSLYTNCMVEGRTQVRLHCISPVEGVQSNITEVISPRDLVGSIIRQMPLVSVDEFQSHFGQDVIWALSTLFANVFPTEYIWHPCSSQERPTHWT